MGPVPKSTLTDEFIEPFLLATVHVLNVQAQVEAKPGKTQPKQASQVMSCDVSGVIAVISEKYSGSMIICFPEKTFLKIVSSMLGETYSEVNKDILDGAGELTNMIFGQAKIVLNQNGHTIQTALPTVVSGKNHDLSANGKGASVVIPFESQAGNFFLELGISEAA